MSYSIQSGQPWSPHYRKAETPDELLRAELGWQDVASGLSKILFGYGLLAVNFLIIVGLIAYVVLSNSAPRRPNAQDAIVAMWVLYLGIGIVGLLSIYTYAQIFIGKCRCAIHAPERCGARWYIFACLLCIVVGPVVGTINSIAVQSSVSTPEKKQKLRDELLQKAQGQGGDSGVLAEIRRSFTITQIASALVSMSTTVFFVLFLRAIGACFEERLLIQMTDFYLMFSALLMGFTIYLLCATRLDASFLVVLVVLGVGGLIGAAWYLALVVYTRLVILSRLAKLRSPLDP